MKCEYCGAQVKSASGLSRHQSSSRACIAARQHLEYVGQRGTKIEASGQKKLAVGPKSGKVGRLKVDPEEDLSEDDMKPAAKRRGVLDMDTMKMLSNAAGGNADLLGDFVGKVLKNPWQMSQDSMGLLPFRKHNYIPVKEEVFAQHTYEDSDDEDDESWTRGVLPEIEDDEEDSIESGDESEGTGEESHAGGQDDDGLVVDEDPTDPPEETEAERQERHNRRLQTWREFQEYSSKVESTYFSFSEIESRAIKIMRTLVKKRAPLDTYPEVMAWHLRELGLLGPDESVGQSDQFISRDKLMKDLRKRYHMAHQYAKPEIIKLPHSKSRITVWKKLARDNVLSLLTDPRWKDEDWLYFGQNPFGKPPEDHPFIEDLNTGKAYQETHKKLITKENQILVPIPLYIDGAVTGQFDKLQVTALRMSIGTLTRKARDKEYGWRNLGFVTNYTKEDTSGRKIFVQSGHVAAHELYMDGSSDDEEDDDEPVDKAADYHAILDVLLESLRELIADGMLVDINYNGKVYKNCELVFFIPFVKCDGDEGDKLCLSYRSRSQHVSQLCRHCKCPNEKTDDVTANYPLKREPELRRLYHQKDLQELKEMSQICAKNAFHGLRFGLHNDRGIHGATPFELLHGVLLGHYKYARDCFFAQLGETSRTAQEVNSLAQEIGRLLQRQSDRNKPRTKFAKGILKGKLMAKEYSGVLLVMGALLQTEEGQRMLLSARKKGYKAEGQVSDWILLVETLLQWETYLNSDQMEKFHVERLKKKHRYLLYLIKRVGDRKTGMGCKVMKFHAVLHLAMDILMFGVPMVVDTGSNEGHHKTTKLAAKLTQKDVCTFEKQTSDRLDDFLVLDLALEEIDGRPLWLYSQPTVPGIQDESLDIPPATGGMILNVFGGTNNQDIGFKVVTRMNEKKSVSLDPQILQFLVQVQEDVANRFPNFKIPICSEHKRNKQIFRSHPNYRNKGPWRDWVIVNWGEHGDFPAKIWGFLDLRELPSNEIVLLTDGQRIEKGVWAMIESCDFVKDDQGEIVMSEMFVHIILETREYDANGEPNVEQRKFYLVDVDSFLFPAVVIPNIGTMNRFIWMRPKDFWRQDFINWIEAKHDIDTKEMLEPLDEENEDDLAALPAPAAKAKAKRRKRRHPVAPATARRGSKVQRRHLPPSSSTSSSDDSE